MGPRILDVLNQKSGGFRKHPLLSAAVISLLVAGLTFWIAARQDTELRKILQAAATTLLLGAFIGGLVKVLLEDVQKAREHREEQARFVTAVLADLKSVYDRAERVRLVIPAHQSALTYGNEMRDLIDGGVQLRNVIRALDNGSGMSPDSVADVCRAVERMERYLAWLTDEFQAEYKAISDVQTVYEAVKKAALKQDPPAMPADPNPAWESLKRLTRLHEFLGMQPQAGFLQGTPQHREGLAYSVDFVEPLDLASWLLRRELKLLLGSAGEPMPDNHVKTRERLSRAHNEQATGTTWD